MRKKRDYKAEYRRYQGRPEQIKRRAKRNAARRKMMRAGRVHKGDDKDVHHKRGIGRGNSRRNLAVVSKHRNRSFHRKGRLKGRLKR